MSRVRSFFSPLTTGTFWAGVGSGIFLLLATTFAIGWVFLSEIKEGAKGVTTTVAPEMPKRETLAGYGKIPGGWTLRPASEAATSEAASDSVRFEALQEGPVVVNKWATWCPPCVAEIETLQSLHASTREEVRVALVSEEDPETVRQFADERDYSVPMYVADQLPAPLKGETVPRTYVVRPDGQVVYRHVGAANWNADRVHRFLGRFEAAPTADGSGVN